RIRHHIRIWLLDSLSLVWIGAANKDVGVIFKPWEPQATHRIDPHIDRERDRIVRDLEAGGCGDLVDYLSLPGAVTAARTVAGHRTVAGGRPQRRRVRSPAPERGARQPGDGAGGHPAGRGPRRRGARPDSIPRGSAAVRNSDDARRSGPPRVARDRERGNGQR